MSILIIALPRTGSSELGRRLSINNKFKYKFEPFNPKHYYNSYLVMSNICRILEYYKQLNSKL